jgi:hypothetical protein
VCCAINGRLVAVKGRRNYHKRCKVLPIVREEPRLPN